MVLISGAVLLAYFPTLAGGFIWDDSAHVTRVELRSLYGLRRIWFDVGATQQYYPLLHSAFWLEHRLWGNAPLGYHLINVIFHISVVWLVFYILRHLHVPGAALAAALFALHPVHVESVAWIAEQKNTLSAIFYLGALLTYLRFDKQRTRTQYLFALALFILGLLTKTVVATLPAALLIVFWWQRGSLNWRRDILPLLPYFALGAAAGAVTAWVELELIGAHGAPFELTLLQRFLLAGRVVCFYVWKLFWPVNLVFIYPRWQVNPITWQQYLFTFTVLGLFLGLWWMRRRSRGPLAAFLFFCVSLLPVLGFLNVYPFVYSFVADHFQYLASLGIIAASSAGITILLSRFPTQVQRIGQGFCILIVGLLGVLTWRHSAEYNDAETLYRRTIDKNAACWMCYNNLGVLYAETGQSQAATEQFHRVLSIKPDHPEAHYNLGLIFAGSGKLQEAIAEYREALRNDPK